MTSLPSMRQLFVTLICVSAAGLAIAATAQDEAAAAHYGWLSLAPALATLVISFWTKNVLLGLLCGVLLGGIVTGQYNVINAYLIPIRPPSAHR